MPANFLHGVETIDVTIGARPIRAVKSAVIGLVGTAPIYAVDAENQKVNTPVLVLSVQDAVKYFSTARAGYTIPQALAAIADQGKGIVVVVNVFDPAVHKTAVALANHVLDANDEIDLGHEGLSLVVVKDAAGAVTYVVDVDYTVDLVTGIVSRKVGGAILAGATLKIGFSFADPSLVVSADIVGSVTGGGDRTGLKALDDAYALFGFNPKILIAPGYSTVDTVVAELTARATTLRAIALVDAPLGTTRDAAIAGRSSPGSINFEVASDRVGLCFPYVKVGDGTVLEPFSQRLAGVIAARDNDRGVHWSPSNVPIIGVVGTEIPLTSRINDDTSDVNALNEAGIITVFNAFGSGFRTWGNRSSAYPTSADPTNFISIRRTADMLHESVEFAMLQFLDAPIEDALIDAIKESVNAFIRVLVGRGALVDGSCTYDPADNPPEEIAAGHLTFGLSFMPPAPAERISFKSFIDINLLSAIGAQQS